MPGLQHIAINIHTQSLRPDFVARWPGWCIQQVSVRHFLSVVVLDQQASDRPAVDPGGLVHGVPMFWECKQAHVLSAPTLTDRAPLLVLLACRPQQLAINGSFELQDGLSLQVG